MLSVYDVAKQAALPLELVDDKSMCAAPLASRDAALARLGPPRPCARGLSPTLPPVRCMPSARCVRRGSSRRQRRLHRYRACVHA